MVNDTVEMDADFLREGWRGCEGRCAHVSNPVGCD